MSLTRVSPALFQVSNNITSVTVGGSANTISLTFDSNGVITGASNNALSVANTAITGNIASSQIAPNQTLNGNVSVTGTLAATGGITATGITSKIQPITASVAASALTITLNPTILDFRASPLTSGTVTTISVPAAISVTIPSTSTMGTVSAVQSRIVVIAINNAGTVELAAVNISGGSVLDETTLITTTAAVAAGNSATAYYSTTARTGVAYRVVGYVESTQATAGTWATAPSTLQGYGGQALAAMSSLGYGQTWQTVTRSIGTTYYNTTGKPICVNINFTAGGSVNSGFVLTVGGYQYLFGSYSTGYGSITQVIPANMSYIAEQNSSAATFGAWRELR